jgi:activator of HSP90 ATPase
MKVNTENIFQVIDINASAQEVFDTFLSETKHSEFTEMAAKIEPYEGGEFEACDGRATGRILKIVKNKRIVVAWTHQKFPKGHFSIVDIQIQMSDNGCHIGFNHLGVPSSCDGWMTETWMKTYWSRLKTYMQEPELA